MTGDRAQFDTADYTTAAGWATYHQRKPRFRWWRCRLRPHRIPATPPVPADGYSPSNYDRCPRCDAHLHWYVLGQHRYGSYDRPTAEAYELITADPLTAP